MPEGARQPGTAPRGSTGPSSSPRDSWEGSGRTQSPRTRQDESPGPSDSSTQALPVARRNEGILPCTQSWRRWSPSDWGPLRSLHCPRRRTRPSKRRRQPHLPTGLRPSLPTRGHHPPRDEGGPLGLNLIRNAEGSTSLHRVLGSNSVHSDPGSCRSKGTSSHLQHAWGWIEGEWLGVRRVRGTTARGDPGLAPANHKSDLTFLTRLQLPSSSISAMTPEPRCPHL